MIGKTMLFNPFTGTPRHPDDIKSDPAGVLVWDGEEPLLASTPPLPQGEKAKPTAREAGEALIEAGHEFWLAVGREDYKARGAVQWLTMNDDALIIFTRGEYRQQLLANIHVLPGSTTLILSEPGDEDADVKSLEAFSRTAASAPPPPAAPVGQVPRKPCDGCRTPSACRDEDYQYSACAPSERTVRVPDGLSQSDAQFWLDRRAQIIETCRAAGLTIVTTAQGVHAMRLGKVEAQARAAIPHPPAEGSQTK
jgi:hypothetical protein